MVNHAKIKNNRDADNEIIQSTYFVRRAAQRLAKKCIYLSAEHGQDLGSSIVAQTLFEEISKMCDKIDGLQKQKEASLSELGDLFDGS